MLRRIPDLPFTQKKTNGSKASINTNQDTSVTVGLTNVKNGRSLRERGKMSVIEMLCILNFVSKAPVIILAVEQLLEVVLVPVDPRNLLVRGHQRHMGEHPSKLSFHNYMF